MALNIKRSHKLAAVALALVAVTGIAAHRPAAPRAAEAQKALPAGTPVEVATATTGDVTRRITVTGSLVALQDVALSSKMAGRLAEITVREGDTVSAGQVVARLDTTDLVNQVRSAEGAVAAAEARVAQAQASYRMQVVSSRTGIESAGAAYRQQKATSRSAIEAAEAAYRQQVESSAANIESAQAALEAARAALSQVKEGARAQEIAQQESRVAVARVTYSKAAADARRYAQLAKEGAISEASAEQYQSTSDVAREQLRATEQALSLLKEGARSQEVVQAEQTVRQAQERLRQARAAAAQDAVRQADVVSARAGQAQDEVRLAALRAARAAAAQDNVKRAELTAAQAGLQQSRSALAIAQQALADGTITSPISGQVAARSADPGQIVAAGAPLLRIVSLNGVYFEPSVADREVGSVRVGQRVDVKVDAFPDRMFTGRVLRVFPAGSAQSRSFPVRIAVENPERLLRPQMYARGAIETARRTGVVLIPRDALLSNERAGRRLDAGRVFTVDAGVAHDRQVTLGLDSPDGKHVEVTGVPAGASVVVAGQRGIEDGTRVTVREPAR